MIHVYVTEVGFRWRIVGDMTGWLGSSVVECSHGQRKALGSSHNFSPVTCIQWTHVLYSVVITRQSNPPISQYNSPCNKFTSFCSMFVYNSCVCWIYGLLIQVTLYNKGYKWGYRWTPNRLCETLNCKHYGCYSNITPTQILTYTTIWCQGFVCWKIKRKIEN